MTATAPEPEQPAPKRRRPTFWERALGDGRQCGRRGCRERMLVWHDGTGYAWEMCRRCDVAAGTAAGK